MDFYETVNSRHTVREFENTPIDDDTIRKIISAGMKAPTNDHMRDWHFIIIRDKNIIFKLIEKIPEKFTEEEIETIIKEWNLNDLCQQNAYKCAIPKQYSMFADAPCVIIPLFRQKTDILHPENLSHLNGFASIWCCIENIFLAVTAEGLGAALRIPLGDEGEWARKVLRFPSDYLMPCMIAVGKPCSNAEKIQQKNMIPDSMIHENIW